MKDDKKLSFVLIGDSGEGKIITPEFIELITQIHQDKAKTTDTNDDSILEP